MKRVVDYLLTLIASWTLAGIFLTATAHKTRHYLEFVGIFNQYKLLPGFSIPFVAPLVVGAEITCVVALLFEFARSIGFAIAIVLLGTYTLAIAINIARGRTAIDCGCGGEATPLSGWLVVRNLTLLILAGAALSTNASAISSTTYLLAVPTTVLLWLIYVTANQLLANWGKRQLPADLHG